MNKIVLTKKMAKVNNMTYAFIMPKPLIDSGVLEPNKQYAITVEEVE